MLDVCSQDDVDDHRIGLAWLHIPSSQFQLPHVLDPLSDTLECSNGLEQLVLLWWVEGKLGDDFLACCNGALGIVDVEILVSALYDLGLVFKTNLLRWH